MFCLSAVSLFQGVMNEGFFNAQWTLQIYVSLSQPRLGGDSRPVQRPQVNEVTSESSFDFLGKTSKGSAFDFVKEEIDSAKKK